MFGFFPVHCEIPNTELDEIHKELLHPLIHTKAQLFSRNLLPPLYHYTNCAGFQGIIMSGVLRATHIAFLNDSSEYIHAVNIMSETVECRLRSEQEGVIKKFLGYVLPRLDTNKMFLHDFPPIFVACFSSIKDDLSQWRAYGRGEDCWSLEFDTRALCSRGMLVPVLYRVDKQREVAQCLLDVTLDLYKRHAQNHPNDQEEHLENWYQMWRACVSHWGPRFKNGSFEGENEWRMIFQPQSLNEIMFIPKAQLMCPIVELRIGDPRPHPEWWSDDYKKKGPMPDRLPLVSVMKGPGNSKPVLDLSKFSAAYFLKQNGYDMEVELSTVPYRTS